MSRHSMGVFGEQLPRNKQLAHNAQLPKIKLCGLMREEDIATANEIQPDMVGFIVDYPPSRRSLTTEALRNLSALVDPSIARVGVFVNAEPELICQLLAQGIIDVVQLHGDEDDAYIQQLRKHISAPIMQAFCIRDVQSLDKAQQSSADMVLLDSGKGNGKTFNWDLIDLIDLISHISRPYFLAGGLKLQNIHEAQKRLHPFGLDMSSGLETDGMKDPDKMRSAVAAVRR